MNLVNVNFSDIDKQYSDKLQNSCIEAMDKEVKAIKKGAEPYDPSKGKGSLLLSKQKQIEQHHKDKISLSEPQPQSPLSNFTALGSYATAINKNILYMPMDMPETDPVMPRLKADFEDAQSTYFQYYGAQAGLSQASTWGSGVANQDTTSRGMIQATTGFFGSKVTLNEDDLQLYRATPELGGTYAQEAISRAISQCVIRMKQQQRYMVLRTLADNQYTYYTNLKGNITDTMSYGRLKENEYSPAEPWGFWDQTAPSGVVKNPNSNPIEDLIDWFTNDENTIIFNTRSYLKGLLMNPKTAKFLTLQALDSGNPMTALGFNSGFKGNFEPDVVANNVPALQGVDLYVCGDTVNLSVDRTYLTVDNLEYYIPDGKIIPIMDYMDVGMGIMLFNPDPRANWLSHTQSLPQNALTVSDNRSTYMRVLSSLEDPRAETPYVSVETGGRFCYVNPIAAGISYMFDVFAPKP